MDDDGSELARLLAVSRAFKLSKALNLACKLDLFTLIAAQPDGRTLDDIVDSLQLCRSPEFRGARDWLDVLVAAGLLDRTGTGPQAKYLNLPSVARYLVRGSPDYMGGIMALNNDRTYVQFEYLEEALRSGQLPPQAAQRLPDIRAVFSGSGSGGQEATERFALGMLGASLGNFRKLAAAVDFAPFATLGDFGGSTGCLAACVAQAHPHMTCTSYDLPAVHAAAQAYVEQQGVAARVHVRDFDFFSEAPFPRHDVICMGMVLHDLGTARKQLLMAKAFEALPNGGLFIAIDHLIDDERRSSSSITGLTMSLNMLLEFGTENSGDYTFSEFSAWAREAGFTATRCLDLVGAAKAAIAVKT